MGVSKHTVEMIQQVMGRTSVSGWIHEVLATAVPPIFGCLMISTEEEGGYFFVYMSVAPDYQVMFQPWPVQPWSTRLALMLAMTPLLDV
jgi:hypothetical protein